MSTVLVPLVHLVWSAYRCFTWKHAIVYSRKLFEQPRHRHNSDTLGRIANNIQLIMSYKGETRGAKGEGKQTPVDPRRLKKEVWASEYSMALLFVCISLMADGPQRSWLPIQPIATLPSSLGSRWIFPSLRFSRLTIFYHDTSSALLQVISKYLHYAYSSSHAFQYRDQNKTPALTKTDEDVCRRV